MKLFAEHACDFCTEIYLTEQESVECAARHAGTTPSSQSHRLRKRAKAAPDKKKTKGRHGCKLCEKTYPTKGAATECERAHLPW